MTDKLYVPFYAYRHPSGDLHLMPWVSKMFNIALLLACATGGVTLTALIIVVAVKFGPLGVLVCLGAACLTFAGAAVWGLWANTHVRKLNAVTNQMKRHL